jgi:hypothetical protein
MEKDDFQASVNPSHYKNFLDDLEWVEAMSRLTRYSHSPDSFVAAIELIIRGYLDRYLSKGKPIEDLLKARWYLTYLCAYMKNECKPISLKRIKDILGPDY